MIQKQTTETLAEKNLVELLSEVPVTKQPKRNVGRPKGSKNKSKRLAEMFTHRDVTSKPKQNLPQQEEGWNYPIPSDVEAKRARRRMFSPQFCISRKDAYELLFKHLRSVKGGVMLKNIILKGFSGGQTLSDDQLAGYIQNAHLLSKQHHEIVVEG
jgi:hypothetical protein